MNGVLIAGLFELIVGILVVIAATMVVRFFWLQNKLLKRKLQEEEQKNYPLTETNE